MIRLAALALALGFFAAAPAAAEPDSAPFKAMRTLQVLQEQVAHGNATAQAAQPQLMAHIADGFLAADPAVWREPRNARAAILFLLSGGKPAAIRTVLTRASFPADLDRLLKGALAYAEGHDDVARALLEPIDPQSLPTALGGHVALIKAGLQVEADGGKAIALLDQARLLAPGTLIEEAALRREVFLLIDAGALDKAVLLGQQYVRRYRQSAYAANFKQRFAAVAAAGDTIRLAKLDGVLAEFPTRETRQFYLLVARSAILNGRITAATFAADKAMALAGSDMTEAARAQLYRAAALVVSDDASDGLAALAKLDDVPFGPEDQNLRTAALAIGKAIQADGKIAGDGTDPGDGKASSAQVTLERGRNILAASDALLARAPH